MDLSAIHEHLDKQDGRRKRGRPAKDYPPHDPCVICRKPVVQRNKESRPKFEKRKTCSPTCGYKYTTRKRAPSDGEPKLCRCGCGVWFSREKREGLKNFEKRPYATPQCYLKHRYGDKKPKPEPKPKKTKAASAPKVAKPKPQPKPEPVSGFNPDTKLPTPKVLLKQQHSVSQNAYQDGVICIKHGERIGAYGCTGCNVEKMRRPRKYGYGEVVM